MKDCKNWVKNSCKFESCEFRHDPNKKKVNNQTDEDIHKTKNDDNESITQSEEYYDYDYFDSESEDLEKNVLEPKRNPHIIVEYACDKCEFKTKSKAKLIVKQV